MHLIKNTSGVKILSNGVAVKLQDGTIISLSDLPPVNTRRWVASAKSAVVKVFVVGLISKQEVLERYDLSHEEFDSWVNRFYKGGQQALKIAALRKERKTNAELCH